ncbi:hypothetical protein FH063_005363 [Azospirillum argentinense]|uniref:Uncharacterized protein n=1 Tax=Azospirillum argentinense TaxID=2970906 RepID=A0A5B0KSD3_9PROT|nr:hypothetical protein FH063_005363 [Azospirillum argentinense]
MRRWLKGLCTTKSKKVEHTESETNNGAGTLSVSKRWETVLPK